MDLLIFTLVLTNGITFLANRDELNAISTLDVFNMGQQEIPIPMIGNWAPTLDVLTQTFDLVRTPNYATPTQFPLVYKLLDYLAAPTDIMDLLDQRINAMQQTPIAAITIDQILLPDLTVFINLEDTYYLEHYTSSGFPTDISFVILDTILQDYRIDPLEFIHMQRMLFLVMGTIIEYLCHRQNRNLRAKLFSWISRHGWLFSRHGNPTWSGQAIINIATLVPRTFQATDANLLFLCEIFKDIGIASNTALQTYKTDKLTTNWLHTINQCHTTTNLDHHITKHATFPVQSTWRKWKLTNERIMVTPPP